MPVLISIARGVDVHEEDLQWHAIRAQGAGGQHVNKTSSAIELRFDIGSSHLPDPVKRRLLAQSDQRLTSDGVLVLKSQQSRSQHRNREDALHRLVTIITAATIVPKKRKPTKPSAAAKRRRLDQKKQRSSAKSLRSSPRLDD